MSLGPERDEIPGRSPVCTHIWFVSTGFGLDMPVSRKLNFHKPSSVHTMVASIQPQTLITSHSQQRGLIRQHLLTLIRYLDTLQSHLMEGITQEACSEGSCKWTNRDVDLMMTYLNEHRSERAEGAFRKPTLHGCAQYVNTKGDHQGKAKDVQAVRGKFKAVHRMLIPV